MFKSSAICLGVTLLFRTVSFAQSPLPAWHNGPPIPGHPPYGPPHGYHYDHPSGLPGFVPGMLLGLGVGMLPYLAQSAHVAPGGYPPPAPPYGPPGRVAAPPGYAQPGP